MNTKPHLTPKLTSIRTLALSLQPSASLGAALLGLALLLAGTNPSRAQSPSAINYQGLLTDNLGKPLASGVYQVQFKIWNSANDTGAGSYIWGRTFPIHVATNGMFNVVLDNSGSLIGTPRTNSILDAFADPDRWLGVSIVVTPDGKPVTATNEISPRQRLVSAPFAIHSYDANTAVLANRAYYAGTATNAFNANNAASFGNLTTNDFLLAKKSSQTLDGTLTIGSSLNVQSWSTFTGNATFIGPLNANGVLNASNIKCGGSSPIVIQQFTVSGIPKGSTTPMSYSTGFPTNAWTAAIAGFTFDADVMETGKKIPYIRLRMVPHESIPTAMWFIEYFLAPEADVTGIQIDVMFIRRELSEDRRPY